MRVKIKATNIVLSDDIRAYAVKKFTSLNRFLPSAAQEPVILEIELGKPSKRHQKGKVYYCEINVSLGKELLRAEEYDYTLIGAVDKVKNEIEGMIKKMKSKRQTKFLRSSSFK